MITVMIIDIEVFKMTWKKILKSDGSETDFLEYRVSKPKGEERIEIIKDIFSKVSEAGDILDAAASWTSPDAYQNITTKISNLLEEIKGLEKEAIEHHGGRIKKEIKRIGLVRDVSFARDKFAEIKSTGESQSSSTTEMNKHKLFMQAKQITKLVNNRKRPSGIHKITITDPKYIDEEEGDVWYWSGFSVHGSGDMGFAGLEPNMTPTATKWINNLMRDIKALDLDGTEIESKIFEGE